MISVSALRRALCGAASIGSERAAHVVNLLERAVDSGGDIATTLGAVSFSGDWTNEILGVASAHPEATQVSDLEVDSTGFLQFSGSAQTMGEATGSPATLALNGTSAWDASFALTPGSRVPEPASVTLLATGVATDVLRRRWRRHAHDG